MRGRRCRARSGLPRSDPYRPFPYTSPARHRASSTGSAVQGPASPFASIHDIGREAPLLAARCSVFQCGVCACGVASRVWPNRSDLRIRVRSERVLMFLSVRAAAMRPGPVAQWKSVPFTPGRSLVRSQPGPPNVAWAPRASDDPHYSSPHPHRPVYPRAGSSDSPSPAGADEFLRIVSSPGQGTVMTDFPRMLLLPRDARASGVWSNAKVAPTTGRMEPASTRSAMRRSCSPDACMNKNS